MKFKVTKAEWDGLDEGIRKLYKAEGDGYVLDVDGLEDTSGLRSALEKERKRAGDSEKISKAFQALGKTPEEISAILQAHEEAEKKKLEQGGEWEKLKQQLLESHKKALDAKDAEIASMRKALESYLVDAEANAVIAEAKGVPTLLLPHVKSKVQVVEENGKFSVRVLGPDGTPRVNAKGEFLGIKDLVGEMRQDEVFGRAFEGTGTTGGGATGGGNSGKGAFVLSREDAKDPVKYRAAKEAAAKAGQPLQIAQN